MTRLRIIVGLTATLLFLPGRAAPAAQQHNWSGCHFGSPTCENATPAWGDSRNWFEGTPHVGDDLVFANPAFQAVAVNTFAPNTRFRSITIGAPHQLFGEPITLDAGISASVNAVIQLSISLNARQTFNVLTPGASLVLQGPAINTNGHILDIDGPGNIVMVSQLTGTNALIKQGTGTLVFVGNQPFTGLIQAREGTVRISGIHSGGMFVEGGRLEGAGTVQGISSSEGSPDFAVAPGGTSPNETGIINSAGDVVFHGTGTFAVDLKGTTAGSGYDQLNVAGIVRILSQSQLAQLVVTLVNFTPSPGDSFVIVNNQGTDPIEGSANVPGEFLGRPEGSSFTVGNTTFFITYRGGDGNDIMLHVPTTRTWNGAGTDSNWKTAANWVGGVAPAVGDDLVFQPGDVRLNNNNNFPAGTLFNSITFTGAGYILQGSAIALRAGITDASTGNNSVAVSDIRLEANQSVAKNAGGLLLIGANINTGGRILTLLGSQTSGSQVYSGVISGTGGINMAASNTVRIEGSNINGTPKIHTYTGATTISSGTLLIRALQPGSPVQVTGGTLAGRGQAGPVTATGGTIRPLDGVPQTLSISGNLQLNASPTMRVAFGRNSLGVVSGRLDVTGTVTLGNSTLVLESTGSSLRLGDQATIINNDGSDAVVGTFASLPEGAFFAFGDRTVQISYQGGDGNDVVVRVTAVPPGGISLIKLTNGTDNDLPPGPTVPVGSTVTFTYIVQNTGTVALQGVTVKDDNGTPDTADDDFNTTFSSGDTNGNGRLDTSETFTFTANRVATEGQHTNVGQVSADPGSGAAIITATNPDNHFGATSASSLGNISTRLRVQDGENVLIGGMIASGSSGKKVIIRAIGPTLLDFGLPGALPDPTLELFQGNVLAATNDDWRLSPQQAEIENSGFAPGKDEESAIIVTLTPNQNYTAIVRGKNGQTGIGVVEAFDLDPAASSTLANISTRGFVDVDDNVMIAGLIVGPSGAPNIRVLVRALGPTLGDFGVQGFLANPTLDLVSSNGTVIRSNNDWKESQQAEIQAAQLAPTHDAEAALIESLPPGAYTAVVRGLNRTTGVGLVEVYNIP